MDYQNHPNQESDLNYVDRVYEPVQEPTAGQNPAAGYSTYTTRPAQAVPHKVKRGIPVFVLILCIVGSVLLGFGASMVIRGLKNTAEVLLDVREEITQEEAPAEKEPADGTPLPRSIARTEDNKRSVADVVAGVADSVVEIRTESVVTSPFMQQYVTEGAGSGVIIRADGTILTCCHVINNASKVTVVLRNGSEYEAELLGADAISDVAVLKIDAPEELTAAVMGDSDQLIVGEDAIVIGNPLGKLGGTVSTGIISALEREIVMDNQKYTLLQTDAAVNPGNSGGALFDSYGNLVGIVMAKSSGTGVEGIGFAIPINTVRDVYEQLVENGYVSGRPVLGISMSEQSAMSFYTSFGRVYVVVTAVEEGSAADQAGIEVGDIILTMDDTDIDSIAAVKGVVQSHEIGDSVEIILLRGNRTMTVTAVLQENTPHN